MIRSKLLSYLWTDKDHKPKDNDRVIKAYKQASDETKAVIDDIFISLCGYSLEYIIEQEPKKSRTRWD